MCKVNHVWKGELKMDFNSVGNVLGMAYQYASRTQKNTASGTSFTESLQEAAETGAAGVEKYTEYLKSKYGNVTIQSVGKDQASLDRVGKSMSGNDVIIAPNILEQMANDPEKAAYYEQKMDDFFEATPQLSASFAAKGLVYEPGGVVVHEDGSVTYIGGCSDSPERVAEVNAINKAKREKEAAQRKASLERSQEAAEQQRQIVESHYQKQILAEALQKQLSDISNLHIVNQSKVMAPAVAAYENVISTFSNSVIENM